MSLESASGGKGRPLTHLCASQPLISSPFRPLNMTDINPSNSRHRLPPLATERPTTDRAQMLQGLRTARPGPEPTSPNPLSALQQAQADYLQQLQLQIQHQSQMLLMQQQAQSEVAFREMQRRAAAREHQQQQQQQQGRTRGGGRAGQQRSSSVEPPRRQQQQAYAEPPRSAVVGGSFLSPEEEEEATTNSKTNPLVASALARRKRQSLNAEAMGALQSQGRERRISSGPADVVHHRQSSSETTASSTSASHTSPPSSVAARTPPASADPPALILSKPGEAYPSTSGSEDDDDDSTSSIKSKPKARRYSVHTAADLASPKPSSSGSNSPDLSAEAQDAVAAKPTTSRRSHVSDLNLALGGRKQRPASISGAIGLGSPQLAGGFGDTPRAVSDTPVLSPFATTFTPLPPSPYFPSPSFDQLHAAYTSPPMPFSSPPMAAAFSPQQMSMAAFSPNMNAFSPNMNTYQSNKPAPASGTASAIRQPRGPAAELAGNFSSRLRRQAVATLLGSRGVGRASLGADSPPLSGGGGGAVMGLGVEVAGAE